MGECKLFSIIRTPAPPTPKVLKDATGNFTPPKYNIAAEKLLSPQKKSFNFPFSGAVLVLGGVCACTGMFLSILVTR